MINRIGYACINTSIKDNFKDCRLASVYKHGIPFLKEIILHNLNLTKEILLWNIDKNIQMYRASSKLIPFSTHRDILRDFKFRWYEDTDIIKVLTEIKKIVLKNDIRLSMHPDHFTVLNSFKDDVVEKSILNLEYHEKLLENMCGTDLIIHTGGVYGDKTKAMKRFIATYNNLDVNIKKYLRLENDDVSYTLSDVIAISKTCGVPVLLDIHHHNCNNGGIYNIKPLMNSINDSWKQTGIIPKCHISTGINDYKDKRHADYISPADLFSFCELTEDIKVDLMVEAKLKELAVLELKGLISI